MTAPAWQYRSSAPGIVWPGIPDQEGAALLALQFQLERTQWLAPRQLAEFQFRQLDVLARHAWDSVPYYRERWRGLYDPGKPLESGAFARLPCLARGDVRAHYEALKSRAIPPSHGGTGESRTSGSTGSPVRVLKTALCELWWRAFTLREHRWHGRDLSARLAAIRQGMNAGEGVGWGIATDTVLETGSLVTLPVGTDVRVQLEWLERQRPAYLLTHPTNLAELARLSLVRGVRLPGLLEARTSGEMLPAETRALCREAWDIPVRDMYSANEFGYLALQCPRHEHYHVQAEGVLLEVLGEDGRPCAAGEIGRVVITSLHNFAMPLVRYDIGDYAEAGASCPCGRGLPVLARIVGRTRNMLVMRDGSKLWPAFGIRGLDEKIPVLQHQFVQKSYDVIEARLVAERPLTPDEERGLRDRVLAKLPRGFELRVAYVENIPRGAGGKFEDFVSEVVAAP